MLFPQFYVTRVAKEYVNLIIIIFTLTMDTNFFDNLCTPLPREINVCLIVSHAKFLHQKSKTSKNLNLVIGRLNVCIAYVCLKGYYAC